VATHEYLERWDSQDGSAFLGSQPSRLSPSLQALRMVQICASSVKERPRPSNHPAKLRPHTHVRNRKVSETMSRESLNITLSESLRKAQIRPRLDALADHTGLNATQIAGRALTLGLAFIESDLRLLFPGQAALSSAAPPAAAPLPAPPMTAKKHEVQTGEAFASTDAKRDAAASAQPPATAQPDVTPPPAAPPEAALPRLVSTADAARALGYREEPAFRQHCNRHPELKRLSRKQGRVLVWNLPKLRAEYEQQGWQPR